MKKSKPATLTFLLNNNVFIAAIKNPRRQTGTLRLILHVIKDKGIALVGNIFLVEEMICYAEEFESETAATLLQALIGKMEIIEARGNFVKVCKAYMGASDVVDIVHAATCLQSDAVLITNDRHFDRIRDEGIIKVWSITDAIQNLL